MKDHDIADVSSLMPKPPLARTALLPQFLAFCSVIRALIIDPFCA